MSKNNESIQGLKQTTEVRKTTETKVVNNSLFQSHESFSIGKWQSEMIRFISWFSSKFSYLSEQENAAKSENNIEKFELEQSFSENRENLYGGLIFLKKNIELLHFISRNITYIKEEEISDFITILDVFKKISDMIYSDREYYQDLLNAFHLDRYSFCPNCNSLEESIDFLLCEKCNNYLIKGDDIRRYFADHFFEKIIKLPPNLANKLYFQFSGEIEEIEYLKDEEIHKKKIIIVPGDSVLGPGKKYHFFTVSENSKLIMEDNMPKVLNTINNKFNELVEQQKELNFAKNIISDSEKNQIKPLICRNCGTKMRLHRTATYYDTNCDLYSCPKCKMKAMINFQPIWEAGGTE
ncbi:MAG: hypothetical protein ACTSWY_06065 [Promethearchaeota archaeon]